MWPCRIMESSTSRGDGVTLLPDLEDFVHSHRSQGPLTPTPRNPPGTATTSPWRARVGRC
jgi:hypothetical protein